jgi:hypothetical protein
MARKLGKSVVVPQEEVVEIHHRPTNRAGFSREPGPSTLDFPAEPLEKLFPFAFYNPPIASDTMSPTHSPGTIRGYH